MVDTGSVTNLWQQVLERDWRDFLKSMRNSGDEFVGLWLSNAKHAQIEEILF